MQKKLLKVIIDNVYCVLVFIILNIITMYCSLLQINLSFELQLYKIYIIIKRNTIQ